VSRTSTGSLSRRDLRPTANPFSVPTRPEEVDAALRELGVRPSKRWGQSFLLDPFVADAIAALAAPSPGQPVVEVGGGLGILTAALARRGIEPLTVIERDRRLARYLRERFGPRITVQEVDAAKANLPVDGLVVGNLPYSATTPILLRLLARRTPRIVALVQKEVAQRLAASAGSRTYGRLSILAALYGTTELFQEVPRSSFYPLPAVDGQVLVHTARAGPLPVPSVERLERVARLLFSSRRKQLGNLLPKFGGGRDAADALALAAGWPIDWKRRRPEELPPEAFFRLASLPIGPTAEQSR
jgi:16S rRNA (adenine1518-N6/adenine1519-N6)-dimethyltransferase